MNKRNLIVAAVFLFLVGCAKNVPHSDFYNEIKDTLKVSDLAENNMVIGRVRIYAVMPKSETRYKKQDISHKCRINFRSETTKSSSKIAKHGLFVSSFKLGEKKLSIDYISCLWDEKIDINFLDLGIEMENLSAKKINYIEDISLFFDIDKKPRKAFEKCSSSANCRKVFIFYPDKITKENNLVKTYQDISKIGNMSLPIGQVSTVKINQKNSDQVRIVNEKNKTAF